MYSYEAIGILLVGMAAISFIVAWFSSSLGAGAFIFLGTLFCMVAGLIQEGLYLMATNVFLWVIIIGGGLLSTVRLVSLAVPVCCFIILAAINIMIK